MRFVFFLLFSCVIFSQEKEKSVERGKLLYEDLCLRCHSPDGKGIKGIYPPLDKSDFLFKHIKGKINERTFIKFINVICIEYYLSR